MNRHAIYMRATALSAAVALTLISFVQSVHGADVRFVERSAGTGATAAITEFDHVRINGPITRQDVQAISHVLAQARQYSLQRYGQAAEPYVFLNSPGGDVLAAIQIGQLLREAAAWTWVFPSAECSSACVFVLAAGVRRFVSPGARVALHRPRFDPQLFGGLSEGKARELYERLIQQCDTYFSKMGFSRELLQQMLKIPSHEARFISRREAENFGLAGEDPSYAEWDRARLHKRYGEESVRRLDRQAECLSRGVPLEQCP